MMEEDLTPEETKLIKKVWRQFCKDSTRGQILTTMSDNREIGNLIYDVCNEELMTRDRADERQRRSTESKAIWALVPPQQKTRMLKRRKLKAGVKSVNF